MASLTIEPAEEVINKIKASVDDVFKFRDEFVVIRGLEAAGCRDQEVEAKMKEALHQVDTLAQHQDVRSGPALGRVLFERGRLLSLVPSQAAAAEQDLGRASKFGAPGAWTLLGECLYNKGDLPAAATCFNRTLSMGEDKVALRNLSMLMRGLPTNSPEQREENINKGVEYARRAVKQDPGDGQSWMVLGNALLASFFAGHANTTTLQACKAAYARAEHDKKASVLPELHLSKHQVAWYEEQYNTALGSIKTACQLEPSWQDCQVKRQQCIKFLKTLVTMVAKKGHLSNKRLQTMIKNIRPNQLGPYENSGTALTANTKPDLVPFSQLIVNTNTDKIVQGMVVSTLVPESGIPFVMCLVDAEGTCLPVSVYNWAPGSEVKIGDAVAVVAPVLKEQTILLESDDADGGKGPAARAQSSKGKTVQDRKKLQSSGSKNLGKNTTTTTKKVVKMTGSTKSKKEGKEEELPRKEESKEEVKLVEHVKKEELVKKEPDKPSKDNVSDIDKTKSEDSSSLNENDSSLSNQNSSCVGRTSTETSAVEDHKNGMEGTEQMEQNSSNTCSSGTQDGNQNITDSSSAGENVKEDASEAGHETTNGNIKEGDPADNVEEVAMEDEVNKNTISCSTTTLETLQGEANEPVSKMARTEAGEQETSDGTGGKDKPEATKARLQSKDGSSNCKTKETSLEKKTGAALPRRTPVSAGTSSSVNSNNNNKNVMLNRSSTDKDTSSGIRKGNAVNAAKSSIGRNIDKVPSSSSKSRSTGLLKKQSAPSPSYSRNSTTLSTNASDTNKNVKANLLASRKTLDKSDRSSVSTASKPSTKDATSSLSAKSSNAVPSVPESSNSKVKCDSKGNSNTPSNKSAGATDGGVVTKKTKPVLGRREAKSGSLAGDKQPQSSSVTKPLSNTGSKSSPVSNSGAKSIASSTEISGEVLLRSLRVVAPVMLVVNKRQVMAGQVAASYIVSQSKAE